ncbi:MAG: hypothetical protein GX596_01650 [Propionibacterium sp.]|nr:hypothetical protein [Propionibacterium sp.]
MADMMHRKDSGLPGDGEGFAERRRREVRREGRPANPVEWSRRAILSVVDEVIPEQRDSLTLLGGHAVLLRTDHVSHPGLSVPTTDGDFAVTPISLADKPPIEQAFLDAGFEHRDPSRPGLWGRGKHLLGDRTDWYEKVDLLVPTALSGNRRRNQRSAQAMKNSPHGKQSAGVAEGIELAAVDRSSMLIRDLADPGRSTRAHVAGVPSLVMAKAYKIGERLEGNPARLRAKDFADLYLLFKAVPSAGIAAVWARHVDSETLGPSIRKGIGHLHATITNPVAEELWSEAVGQIVGHDEVRALLDAWTHRLSSLL